MTYGTVIRHLKRSISTSCSNNDMAQNLLYVNEAMIDFSITMIVPIMAVRIMRGVCHK